jgi:hypothetical protein
VLHTHTYTHTERERERMQKPLLPLPEAMQTNGNGCHGENGDVIGLQDMGCSAVTIAAVEDGDTGLVASFEKSKFEVLIRLTALESTESSIQIVR